MSDLDAWLTNETLDSPPDDRRATPAVVECPQCKGRARWLGMTRDGRELCGACVLKAWEEPSCAKCGVRDGFFVRVELNAQSVRVCERCVEAHKEGTNAD